MFPRFDAYYLEMLWLVEDVACSWLYLVWILLIHWSFFILRKEIICNAVLSLLPLRHYHEANLRPKLTFNECFLKKKWSKCRVANSFGKGLLCPRIQDLMDNSSGTWTIMCLTDVLSLCPRLSCYVWHLGCRMSPIFLMAIPATLSLEKGCLCVLLIWNGTSGNINLKKKT